MIGRIKRREYRFQILTRDRSIAVVAGRETYAEDGRYYSFSVYKDINPGIKRELLKAVNRLRLRLRASENIRREDYLFIKALLGKPDERYEMHPQYEGETHDPLHHGLHVHKGKRKYMDGTKKTFDDILKQLGEKNEK